MALTYTQDELNQLRAGFQSQQQSAQASQKPQAKGNFLTHLLPSVGGIGGGVAGGAAGGALAGTAILPGVGTVAGGLIGALLGGAAGGGLGKVGENAIEHQALGNGVAKEAAINGIFSAGPLRLLKGAGVAGKVLAGIGDNSAAAETAAQGGGRLMQALNAGGQAGGDMSLLRSAGKALTGNADKMTAKQFSLTPTQQFNFKNLHGEDATQTLRKYNVSSPEQIGGHIDNLQNSFTDVVHHIPSMKIGDVNTALVSKYQPLLDSPNLTEQALGKQLKAQADEIMGHLSNKANGSDLVSASDLNALRGNFDNSVKYTLHGSPEMNTAKETADTLRGLLQQSADNAGVKTADGKTFKEVGLELSKLHDLNNITGRQAYTGGGNPVKLTDMLAASAGGAAGGPGGAMLTAAATHAINSPTGKKALVEGSLKAGKTLTDKASNTNPFGLKSIAKRDLPAGLVGALGSQSGNSTPSDSTNTSATSQSIIDPLSQNSAQNASATTGAPQGPQDDPSSPLNPANVEQGVQAILANGGKMSDVTAYLGMVKSINDLKGTTAKPLNSTQQQQAFNAQSGLSSLNDIAAALQKNPNEAKLAALPGGGLASSLTGTGSYKAAIANATDVIGRLRSGGAIGQEEEKQFKSLLPQTFDTPQTAAYKLNQLNTLFSQFANPQAAAQDPTTLLSSLGAQ